ncbi:hypothetical protein BLA29_003357, partial [Euroglyphus maynei]
MTSISGMIDDFNRAIETLSLNQRGTGIDSSISSS